MGDEAPVSASSTPPVAGSDPLAASPPPRDEFVGSPAAGDGGMKQEVSVAEVVRLKCVLEKPDSPKQDLLDAIAKLRSFGSLPTKVLGDTRIGIVLSSVSKNAQDEAVRSGALQLVQDWRATHRKRKASVGPDSKPSGDLQRSASTGSIFSEQDNGPAASPKANRDLERSNSLFSMGEEQAKVPAVKAEQRDKVRQKIVESLTKDGETIESKDEKKDTSTEKDEMRDPVVLGAEIEQALADQCTTEKEYLSQARSILFNLKDSKNPTFRFKLMVGFYKPEQVPKLTAEDMASDEKNAERAKLRKYSMEEIQSDWALKNGQLRLTGMFTCGKCKGTKTTYFQMQTRSSDEPMTTFVTCLTCNNRWKFC